MNIYLRQDSGKLERIIYAICRVWLFFNRLLRILFNKNIYTRILFTNITAFVAGLIILMTFSSSVVQQITYDQVQQDLLRKAKRVNFALLHQMSQASGGKPTGQTNGQVQSRRDLLIFLADIFDTRITVFNRAGNIMETSAEQEVVPGSKVETKFVEILDKGETAITKKVEQETGQITFIAIVPMGNNKNTIIDGIVLETKPSNLDFALNKMRLYLTIGGMIVLVVFIFVSVYLAMYISRPISRLATTVTEISRGSDILGIGDQPLDEINALASQLNKLSVRLQKIQAENYRMEEERARLFGEISHELRTPLTSVQGFVEAIRDGMVQDGVLLEKYIDTIYTQTLHINRLVDDMLVLSRLEGGNITVEKLPLNLSALAQSVVMSMEAAANNKNITILLEKKTENAIVIGDVDRMEQIIRNLLKNAIMASKNGIIRVGVVARQGEVVLTIEDNGIGIAPEDLPRVWDRFYRVKNQRDSHMQEKGSGLGLVIVKKLVQLQDGNIDVESQLGKGTTFSITFPSFDQKSIMNTPV